MAAARFLSNNACNAATLRPFALGRFAARVRDPLPRHRGTQPIPHFPLPLREVRMLPELHARLPTHQSPPASAPPSPETDLRGTDVQEPDAPADLRPMVSLPDAVSAAEIHRPLHCPAAPPP